MSAPEPSPLTDTSVDAADAPTSAETTSEPERGNPNREAARYRTRLREVEAERDRLAQIVERHQRADVERALSESKLADPADLRRDGLTLDELLDDDGSVDADKLDDAVAKLLDAHPSWAKQTKVVDLGQGPRGNMPARVGLDEAIRDAVRRR